MPKTVGGLDGDGPSSRQKQGSDKRWTIREHNYLVELFTVHNNSVAEAAETLGRSYGSVDNYARINGMNPRKERNPSHPRFDQTKVHGCSVDGCEVTNRTEGLWNLGPNDEPLWFCLQHLPKEKGVHIVGPPIDKVALFKKAEDNVRVWTAFREDLKRDLYPQWSTAGEIEYRSWFCDDQSHHHG